LLLRNDVADAEELVEGLLVNNPSIKWWMPARDRSVEGQLTYSSFVRDIERVLVHDHTVVVMGSETVVPSGQSADAGKTIHRRFTDVWMNEDGHWLLIARHASVICGG